MAAELKAKASLDSSAWDAGLRQAQSGVKKFAADFAVVGQGIAVGAAAASAAVVAYGALAKEVAAYDDAIGKAAIKTGLSTEMLSRLQHAANVSDTSLETLQKASKELIGTLDDASNGSDSAKEKFTRLGLSWEVLKKQSPDDQIMTVLTAISRIENPTERAARAMDLLGKKVGPELLPMLNDGKNGLVEMMNEADKLGLIVTEEQATSAGNFNDELTRIGEALLGLSRQFVDLDSVTPILQNITKFLSEIIGSGALKELGQTLGESIRQFTGMEGSSEGIVEALKGANAELAKMNANDTFSTLRDVLIGTLSVVAKIIEGITFIVQKLGEGTIGRAVDTYAAVRGNIQALPASPSAGDYVKTSAANVYEIGAAGVRSTAGVVTLGTSEIVVAALNGIWSGVKDLNRSINSDGVVLTGGI